MRKNQRVYWNGIFPKPNMRGTVEQTGTIRSEVRWDDCPEKVTLQYNHFLGAVSDLEKKKR